MDFRRELDSLHAKLTARFYHNASKEDIEDAISSAFEKLLTKGIVFEDKDGICAWLYVTSRNHLLNTLRKIKRHRPVNLENAANNPLWDRAIEAFVFRNSIESALENLAKDDRDLLLDRFERGESVTRIAKSRGVKIEQLKSRSKRSLKKVQRKLKKIGWP